MESVGADFGRFGGEFAGRAQQLFAFRHRFSDKGLGVMLGLGRAFVDEGLRAAAGIAQGGDEIGEHGVGAVARLLEPLGLAGEARGKLGRRAPPLLAMMSSRCRSASPVTISKPLRLAAERADGLFHAGALLAERRFEMGTVLLQALQQFAHLGAVALLAPEHEFGAAHRGIGDFLDASRLTVEFDGGGMGRVGGGACRASRGSPRPAHRVTEPPP